MIIDNAVRGNLGYAVSSKAQMVKRGDLGTLWLSMGNGRVAVRVLGMTRPGTDGFMAPRMVVKITGTHWMYRKGTIDFVSPMQVGFGPDLRLGDVSELATVTRDGDVMWSMFCDPDAPSRERVLSDAAVQGIIDGDLETMKWFHSHHLGNAFSMNTARDRFTVHHYDGTTSVYGK